MTSKFDGLECICDTCAGDGSICYMVGAFYAEPGADFSKVCDRYRRRVVTNYEKLFGTPGRAANILALGCIGASEDVCDSCVFRECDGKLRRCGSIHSIATQMLEWLESEVRDD